MPYITQERRKELETEEFNPAALGNGDLNYLISSLINELINAKGLSYETINGIVGVLECTKLELYRRVAAKYEDKKKKGNGDVYDCQ